MGNRPHAISLYLQAQRIKDGDNPLNLPGDHAYRLMASAVMQDPTMGLGWYEYGNANSDNMWRHAAVASYRRALELPDGGDSGDLTSEWRAKCMVNLAHNLHHIGRNREAKDIVQQALRMNDRLENGWLTLSLIQNVEGQLSYAQESARKAMAINRTPAIEIGLAFALMYDRKFAHGLKHFEARFEYVLRQFLTYPYPQWHGEPGKTVFLVSEQGMGDALSFSRFVPALIERSHRVHIRVNPELMKLFRIMFQRYDNITIEPIPCQFPAADCWTTFMSLPVALGLSDKEIIDAPALPCPSMQIDQSWRSTDRDLHIGVSWTGSQANWINNHRSFPIELLLELYRIPGVQLYSLQVDDAAQHIHDKGMASLIRDMKPYIRDVCDTLAILDGLDLIVTCESALGHIAGLAGKPCIIPYSHHGGDFRIGRTEEGSIWYPGHVIFKQGRDAEWAVVFDRIVRYLERRQRNAKADRVA
jgi:tetratricopeptide (TPR) repeat protein